MLDITLNGELPELSPHALGLSKSEGNCPFLYYVEPHVNRGSL